MGGILYSGQPASSFDLCNSISEDTLTSASADERHSVGLSDRSVGSYQLLDFAFPDIKVICWHRNNGCGPQYDRLSIFSNETDEDLREILRHFRRIY